MLLLFSFNFLHFGRKELPKKIQRFIENKKVMASNWTSEKNVEKVPEILMQEKASDRNQPPNAKEKFKNYGNDNFLISPKISKNSSRFNVFRKKLGSVSEKNEKIIARRTSSLGVDVIQSPSSIQNKIIPTLSNGNRPLKGKFCCSFRQPKLNKKLVEQTNSLSLQPPCVLLTPEYGPSNVGSNISPTTSPKGLPESSIMSTSNAIEEHLLSAIQPSSLPTRRGFFMNLKTFDTIILLTYNFSSDILCKYVDVDGFFKGFFFL